LRLREDRKVKKCLPGKEWIGRNNLAGFFPVEEAADKDHLAA
jgi:hypothetical protein